MLWEGKVAEHSVLSTIPCVRYLDQAQQQFDDLVRKHPAPFSGSGSIDDLLKGRFAEQYAELLERGAQAKRTIRVVSQEHARRLALPWWRRLFTYWEIRALAKTIDDASQVDQAVQAEQQRAWTLFSENSQHREAAQHTLDLQRQQRQKHVAATAFRERATALKQQLAMKVGRYAAIIDRHAPRADHAPSIDTKAGLAAVLHYFDQLESFLKDRLPALVARYAALAEAENVLRELLDDTPNPIGDAAQTFELATVRALHALLTASPYPQLEPLTALLTRCTDPHAFQRHEAWLIFWTAVSAITGYARKSLDSASAEDPKADWWCAQWEAQIKAWGATTLSALGLDRQAIRTARLHLQNTKAETAIGGDVLLMLWVVLPDRQYCRVANIQFKRAMHDEKTVDVFQHGWRQFDTLVSLHRESTGRWLGLHALLRKQLDGLASVPALLAPISLDVLGRQVSQGNDASGRQARSGSSAINWESYGESLATALAGGLCGTTGTAFASFQDAFDWVESQGSVGLTEYMLIQSVGGDADHLNYAMRRAQEWARRHGHDYSRSAGLKHFLGREAEHDHGPSL